VSIHDNADQLVDTLAVGYTIDDEGLINNFAVEPEIYPSAYPLLRK